MTDGNGASSAGRFERIEAKLDKLIDDNSGFRLDVVQRLTRLETTTAEARSKLETAAADARDKLGVSASEARGKMEIDAGNARASIAEGTSIKTLHWMQLGIIASILIGTAGLGVAIFFK